MNTLRDYLDNLRAWRLGWSRFNEIVKWRPGYGPDKLKWRLLYATDYLVTVLVFAGPVASLSWWMNLHRDGKIWDATLDAIERVDPKHGAEAGGPLWGTVDCDKRIRVVVPALWAIFIVIPLLAWWIL